MHRLITILCALILLGGMCWAQQPDSPLSIRILADNEEYDWVTQHFKADGNVRVTYGDTLLTADTVVGNRFTGEVLATGNVTFTNGPRTLTGETFSYNYKTNIGVAGDAAAVVDNVYFKGEELRSEPDRYVLGRSTFTTCNLEHPHYYMSAREMEIIPGDKFIARGVSIYLYGARLLTVPKYSMGLRKDNRASHAKLPQIGISGRYGAFAGYKFDLSAGPATIAKLDARVSTKEVFQGGLEYERIAGQPVFLRLTYLQPYYGGTSPYTLLTRMPELGFRYGSKRALETYSALGTPLGLSRALLDPERPAQPGEINFIGEVGAGAFTEHPADVSSGRFDARLLVWVDTMPVGSKTVLSPGISARFSHYGTGDDYSTVGLQLGVGKRFGRQSYGSLTYVKESIHGATPFTFDQVELPEELAGRVGFSVGSMLLELGGRYDLDRGRMYDSEVSISKRFHCLQPKLTWRNRFQQFSIDVGVVGF